jgi:hypothetical protein
MMTTTMKLYARTGASAIAAALALSSTPLIAQEAPASTQPVTTVTPPPPTTSDSLPPATTTDTAITPDTSTTDTATVSTATPKRTVTRAKAITRTKTTSAAVPLSAVHRSVTTQAAHVTATRASVAAKAATPAPAEPPPSRPGLAANSTLAPAHTAATNSGSSNDAALEFGAGALALIVLGGATLALSRRRRRDEFVEDGYEPVHEPVAEAEPAEPAPMPNVHEEQPAIVAPSAFAWGNERPLKTVSDDGSDRRPGESWVERAYRGPSPANPSASLRNRLKRAAFFDKRERQVAAGEAEPVDTDAGLPETMADEQERELA